MDPLVTMPFKEAGYNLECGYFIAWAQEKIMNNNRVPSIIDTVTKFRRY